MKVEFINTGNELLNGARLNTHQKWLGEILSHNGYSVTRQTAVADDGASIEEAVEEALGRADVIITTGGLGPTSDDLTREKIAALLDRELFHDPTVEVQIRERFAARGKATPKSSLSLALIPKDAIVITNHNGTAPGLLIEHKHCESTRYLIMLPGPPRELYPMVTNQVLPLLAERFPDRPTFTERFLRISDLGESTVEERISDKVAPLREEGLEVSYCLHPGYVDVRFTASGKDANRVLDPAVAATYERLGEFVFTDQVEEIEETIIRMATERKATIAVAESCTGGTLSNRLTNVSGSSSVFLCGLTTYANSAKQTFLGVSEKTLSFHGAVSSETAIEMAEGLRKSSGADFAVTTTGIAGPTGGTDEKPVGTVFIGYATPDGSGAIKRLNPDDRHTFKLVTSQQALNLLFRLLQGKGPINPLQSAR